MQKPTGYDESQAFTGEFEALAPGGYICVIKKAVVDKTDSDKERINILFDIAEGDSKGYYQNRFNDAVKSNSEAKWQGVHRQFTEGKSTPFFKGLITSIEASNQGYKWDWNEKSLIGKFFGALIGREQYEGNDGKLKWATKCVAIRSVQTVRKGVEAPKDKFLPNSLDGLRAAAEKAGIPLNEGVPIPTDDDLPF